MSAAEIDDCQWNRTIVSNPKDVIFRPGRRVRRHKLVICRQFYKKLNYTSGAGVVLWGKCRKMPLYGMNIGCIAFAVLMALTGAVRGEGAYVLNAAGGGSVLPADCSGFATLVSDNKPISKQMRDGNLVWTSNYEVEAMPEQGCRMGFPLCVMDAGVTSQIGNGFVVIDEAGQAQLTCQMYPVFD